MLSLKNVKDGGVAIVFGKEFADDARMMFTAISAKLFGQTPVEYALLEAPKEKTLADVKKKVEGNSTPRLRLNLEEPVKVTRASRIKNMNQTELRQEIARVMYSIEETHGVHKRKLYYELYEQFRQAAGIDIKTIKQTRSNKGKGGLTKLDTLVTEGYGVPLATIAYEIYDRYASKA